MISNISWGSYCLALTILTCIYYLFVFLVYFRKDFVSRLAIGKQGVYKPSIQTTNASNLDKHHEDDEDPLLPVVRSLTGEISAYLDQVSYTPLEKSEIMKGLKGILDKYPLDKIESFSQVVNSLIQFECKDKCAMIVEESEVSGFWNRS